MPSYAALSATAAVKYAPEQTKGTRPTTGYTVLSGVTAVPAFGDQPGTVDVTALANTNRVYIFDLPDSGGTIAISVNDADDFRTSFTAMKTAYETAVEDGKGFWIEYAYPTETNIDSFYYPAAVHDIGFGGWEVGAAMTNSVPIAPAGNYVWETPST
jgi:hypothetical protein